MHTVWGDLPRGSKYRMIDLFEWFLKNAKSFDRNHKQKALEYIELGYRKPEFKSCYHNSMLCGRPSQSKYYEGWASLAIPIEHAWNIIDDQVIDTTLTLFKEERQNISYLGIEIPWTFVHSMVDQDTNFHRAGTSGPFLFDYILQRLEDEEEE